LRAELRCDAALVLARLDDGDAIAIDPEMPLQQRQHRLPDAAESEHDQAAP
jgi:hypothetical protein